MLHQAFPSFLRLRKNTKCSIRGSKSVCGELYLGFRKFVAPLRREDNVRDFDHRFVGRLGVDSLLRLLFREAVSVHKPLDRLRKVVCLIFHRFSIISKVYPFARHYQRPNLVHFRLPVGLQQDRCLNYDHRLILRLPNLLNHSFDLDE